MRLNTLLPLVAAVLLASASHARAQAAPDPSGHWKGSIAIPGSDLAFEVDIARNADGELIGTITGTDVKSLPFTKISVNGRSVSFAARSDQPFVAELSGDGRTMWGRRSSAGMTCRSASRKLARRPLSQRRQARRSHESSKGRGTVC